MSLPLLLLADVHGDLNRRAFEAEFLAQGTLDVAAVAVLEEAGGEDHETRRARGCLRGEEDSRLLATTQRVRVGGLNFAEEGVELACRNTLIPGFQGLIHGSRQTVGVPAGLGGQIHTLGPHHTVEFGVPQAFETLLVELVHRIPLIEHEHDRTARIHGCGHDLQILIGYRLRSIKQDQRQFTALDGGLRAQRGIIFRACELVLASLDAGRVDEQPVLAIDVDDFVDGVARRRQGIRWPGRRSC